ALFLAFVATETGAIFRAIMILRVSDNGEVFDMFAFPMISLFVLFASMSLYVFTSQAGAPTLRIAHRPLPLTFIFKFSGILAGLIVLMTMIKFYLGSQALSPASFLSGTISSGAAVTSIATAVHQKGGMEPWTAGLAIVGVLLGSLYAKYVVVSRHIGW